MLRVACAVGALLLSIGCHPNRPVVDATPSTSAIGTIAGIVSDGGGQPIGGRKVVAVNVTSGSRVEGSSTSTGGYTLRVPPGTYRMELELRSGETTTSPEPTEVDPGDLDAGRNFVVTVAGR